MLFVYGTITGIALALIGGYIFVVWLSDFDGNPFPPEDNGPQ